MSTTVLQKTVLKAISFTIQQSREGCRIINFKDVIKKTQKLFELLLQLLQKKKKPLWILDSCPANIYHSVYH